MKATLDTPNTLLLALWSKKPGAVIIGNLRTDAGIRPVLADGGKDALALLAAALDDVVAVAARHIIVFTNDTKIADLYRRPVRLEPTAPDRMAHYVPDEWRALRRLCGYQSWQIVQTTALPKARCFWEETYGNAK